MSEQDTLLRRLRAIDPEASELVSADDLSWIRTRLGIVGEVRLDQKTSLEAAPAAISAAIERAHSLLDVLPLAVFRRSDMWNLLLFVAVPYDRNVAAEQAATLEEQCRDLVGSRKVLLWKKQRIEEYLQPFKTRTPELAGSDDPLREVLKQHARDAEDLRVFDFLYKRRLEEMDIDELVRALSREVSE